MEVSQPAPDVQTPLFFCPTCGYNLTGLVKDRCPECGKAFDRAELERLKQAGTEPIELRGAIIRLLWPPGLYLAAMALAGFSNSDAIVVVFFFGSLFLLAGGAVNGWYIAGRLAATQALREPTEWPDRRRDRFVRSLGAVLWFCQLAVGFGGCGAAWMRMMG